MVHKVSTTCLMLIKQIEIQTISIQQEVNRHKDVYDY
jgi:hypothetical protein